LITGERGTGKRRLARWLHAQSRRGTRPLVSVDAVSERATEIVQGLARALPGRDIAGMQPGNLLVENFQAASQELVHALLELLSAQGLELKCGVILLSTEAMTVLRTASMEHGRLLGRSGSSIIELPPLRERSEDVGVLARAFLEEAAKHYGRSVRGLSPQALTRLAQHGWPGNARELRASVEQALLRSTGDWVTADDLPLPSEAQTDAPHAEVVIRMPGSSLREIELQAIKLALRLASGRLVRASELLGITRHALRRKLEKYGLHELRIRSGGAGAEDGDDAFI
jgi:DNA-binding NtrC family response regulator